MLNIAPSPFFTPVGGHIGGYIPLPTPKMVLAVPAVQRGPATKKKGPYGTWRLLCTCLSMAEGMAFIVNGGIKDNHGEGLHFKFVPNGSGGTTRKAYKCISHENCPVLVRTALKGGSYAVEAKDGLEHSKVKAVPKRCANCALTRVQEEDLRKSVNEGSKPAAILSCWSAAVLEQQPHAPKRKKGGLEGKYTYI